MGLIIFVLAIIIIPAILLFNLIGNTEKKINFISSFFSRCLIKTEVISPTSYCINIPIKIYNLHRISSDKPYRIHFDLIYFDFTNGEFSTGDTKISYSVDELYSIFKKAVRDNKATISINLIPRILLILPITDPKLEVLDKLKILNKESKEIANEIKNINFELGKIESLIKTVQKSELYNYQVATYEKGLLLLKNSQSKAIFMQS